MFTFFSSHHRTDFTLYARTQNDTHATRFEIIPGLLGVDCRRAIRLRRDHVLRVEGRRENHRRRHRRGAWRRLHAEGTFLLSRGNPHSFFSRARAEEGETLPTTTARSVGRKEQRDAFSRARFFRQKKVLCFAMGCCSRAFLFNTNLRFGRFCALHFRKCEQKALFPLKGCRFVLTETCFVLIVEAHTSSSSSSSSSPLKNHRHTKPATARLP